MFELMTISLLALAVLVFFGWLESHEPPKDELAAHRPHPGACSKCNTKWRIGAQYCHNCGNAMIESDSYVPTINGKIGRVVATFEGTLQKERMDVSTFDEPHAFIEYPSPYFSDVFNMPR